MEKAGFGSEEVDVRWAAAETRMGETFEARMCVRWGVFDDCLFLGGVGSV